MSCADPEANDAPVTSCIQLPPEILTAVFSQINLNPGPRERGHVVARFGCGRSSIEGDEVLRHVSLTCWSFHDLALPIRFRRVDICTEEMGKQKTSEPFARLAASERLRNLVKVVSLRVYRELPESAEAIVCRMPNLKVLHLVFPFDMTQPLYNHICSLRSLQRLEVGIPHLGNRNTDTITTFHPSQTKLHSVVVAYRMGGGWYGKGMTCRRRPERPWGGLPPWLVSLTLSPSVRDLSLPLHAIPLPITSGPTVAPSLHLTTLRIIIPDTMSEWEEFKQFITRTSLITNLILDKREWKFDRDDTLPATDPPLPSNLLPALQRFEGDLRFAKQIVPGRPVSAIELSSLFLDDSPVHLRPLSLSTATVRSLVIRGHISLESFAAITTLFPHLEELLTRQIEGADEMDTLKWAQKYVRVACRKTDATPNSPGRHVGWGQRRPRERRSFPLVG